MSLKDDAHKAVPRTFQLVVASPGRVTCVLNERAYGKWNSNAKYRTSIHNALEPIFRQITIVAPPRSKPDPRSNFKVLAEWLRPDVGAMY